MSSPGNVIDPLFWPLVIFAVAFAAALLAIVAVVMVMARRGPGVHIQHAETGGSIEHKPSTRTTPSLNVDKLSVNSPQLRVDAGSAPHGDLSNLRETALGGC